MHLAKKLHLKPSLIDYRNSGDTAGDRSAVVGYGAFAFLAKTEPAAPSAIPERTQKILLKAARAAITRGLGIPCEDPLAGKLDAETEALLQKNYGVFVSLHIHRDLRGCIGVIETQEQLRNTLPQHAQFAAFHDSRFPPLMPEELDEVTIEISLLSPPKPLAYKDADDLLKKLIPRRHGVVLGKGFQRATFLPQVWETLPKKEDFLSHLCAKAGLPSNEWQIGKLKVETYEAEVFAE
jgi:AmmeMemoRadiSam system protein A